MILAIWRGSLPHSFVIGKQTQRDRVVATGQDLSDGAGELVCGAEGQTRAASRRSNQIRNLISARPKGSERSGSNFIRFALGSDVSGFTKPHSKSTKPRIRASLGRHSGKLPTGGGWAIKHLMGVNPSEVRTSQSSGLLQQP